ncbi:MAG TPA: hypothetical protein VKE51_21065 [Vicinamibacterales bacterium]|nr:hypothetical protein [Vicinamibacterales bacterium]
MCGRTITADVVALDQAYQVNRLGTSRPGGLLFALRHDVEAAAGGSTLQPGQVRLKAYKRPRPIVLRVNVGDCVDIQFQNLLAPAPLDPITPVTRNASIHVSGLQLRGTIDSDGTWAGANPASGSSMSGLVAPGGRLTYRLYAAAEGANLLYSTAADYNGFGTMQLTMGLFGAVNVEPPQSEWYRSQVTEEDLRIATTGTTPDGHPILDYDAVYPQGNPRAGLPVLRMLAANNRLVHSDLTAVITGPRRGPLTGGPGTNPVLPDRNRPFREITVHYHESQDLVQSFPYFFNPSTVNTPTVNAGQDSFAINYGVGGIAPEILANRIGVGPSRDCVECKFEEFFLSSWPLGDPGLVVDVPANAAQTVPCALEQARVLGPSTPCAPLNGGKNATKAFYPDDPSNVYHSYLGDHVRFRILHAGAAVHHVHHHHAHQWLHEAENQDSNYLDSQSIGPGSAYTLELVYEGSGNRNLTAGDSIFHCHFYPHFASGMWALYRVHDAFEAGTPLDAARRPRSGARALPDGEIDAGTPIPAVVPLPTMAMAPMPSKVEIVNGQVKLDDDGFPGYPFYVPGVAGHRAPHPPLDFAVDPKASETYDGGLPRHLVTGGTIANEQHSTTDWSKDLSAMTADQLPEDGTASEKRAMQFFGQHLHDSFTPAGQRAAFRVNGLPNGPQHGAPYADPAVVDGKAAGNPARVYKGVHLQLDTIFNKAGWHYPQQRMMALWRDVPDLVSGKKPPEPLFFRASSNDVVEYWHTNLVPAYFELDDFEVRTPTDILGQHIHLVKFDVQASDGAGNGFNYEDGTYSPEEVRGRIAAINASGGLWDFTHTRQTRLAPKAIGELGSGPNNAWLGAQATVQRWWVDPLMDTRKNDRTYMTVFTHDHFGPSTHQMIGLYGGLLVEPEGTKWTSLDGKTEFRTRDDGGPTSYAANILYNDPNKARDNYREFALEWGDLQQVYSANSRTVPDCYTYTFDGKTYGQQPPAANCRPVPSERYTGWSDPANVLNCPRCSIQPPPTSQPATPPTVANLLGFAPSPPTPLLIGDFGAGMMSMNYRTEPLTLRINKPTAANPHADPHAGDLAHAFRSIPRFDPAFSTQPAPNAKINPACTSNCFTFPTTPISDGMQPTDPFTPLLQGFEGDKVQIRLLGGAHTSMHDFNMHALRWKAAPFSENSGYRNSQFIVLSEHFEMLFDLPRLGGQRRDAQPPPADYIYNPTASYEGLTNGIWGLLRSYSPSQSLPFLAPLRQQAASAASPAPVRPPAGLSTNCERVHPCLREFHVHATTVQRAIGTQSGGLVYNGRGINLGNGRFDSAHPLNDPYGLVYVLEGAPLPASGIEPLVLRAAAGDWIHVTLVNDFDGKEPVFTAAAATESAYRFAQIPYAFPYVNVNLTTSANIGLHPQLVELDVTDSDGANAGRNPVQTAAPLGKTDYWWYAGKIENGKTVPVEFGSINLMPADPLMHVYHGLFGALIIEPAGSQWIEDPNTRAAATVFDGNRVFREFVLIIQDDVSIQLNGQTLYGAGFPLSAFNYRSEPFFYRFGANLADSLGLITPNDWTNLSPGDLSNVANLQMSSVDTTLSTANQLVGGDPVTPILRAPAGMPVRIRLLSPGGIGDNQQVFELTGHVWQEAPYTAGSTRIGFSPTSNWTGTTPGFGPTTTYEVVLEDAPNGTGGAAGGRFHVPGDYLYRSWTANQFQAGTWGLFRVAPSGGTNGWPDTVGVLSVAANPSGGYDVRGFTTVAPASRRYTSSVTLDVGVATATASVKDGLWSFHGNGAVPSGFTVRSLLGGHATWGTVAAPAQMTRAASETATMSGKQAQAKKPAVRQDRRPRQPR